MSAEVLTEPARLAREQKAYEYKGHRHGQGVEKELNELGAEGWQVVGSSTKKQLFIAPPAAIILTRVAVVEQDRPVGRTAT